MKTEFIIKSEEETCRLAKIISEYCFSGFLVTLNGELGAGKTRFSKALGEYLGIKQNITSPTFNILKCYFEGRLPLYHIDAYRSLMVPIPFVEKTPYNPNLCQLNHFCTFVEK